MVAVSHMALGGLGRVRHGAAKLGSPCDLDARKSQKYGWAGTVSVRGELKHASQWVGCPAANGCMCLLREAARLAIYPF